VKILVVQSSTPPPVRKRIVARCGDNAGFPRFPAAFALRSRSSFRDPPISNRRNFLPRCNGARFRAR
jgi:hypothetical protein